MKSDTDPRPARESASNQGGNGHPIHRVRRFAISALLIVSLPLIGAGIAYWLSATKPDARRREAHSLPPMVEVQTLIPQDVQEVFAGYGSARADREVLLSAEVSGRIVNVAEGLKDGSCVIEDQVLVRIDDRPYLQRLSRAESQSADVEAQLKKLEVEKANAGRLVAIAKEEVEVTRNEYKRLTNLYERHVASKKEWDFARLAYQRSRRELQALENTVDLIEPSRDTLLALRDGRTADKRLAALDVERCTIKAPFSGQVDNIVVEQGDHVRVGSQVLRMIDPQRIEVPIELPASVYPRTKIAASCELTMESLPDERWQATVHRMSPVADERSRTFIAYAEVDNAAQETPLVPGYFVTAKVVGPVLRQVFAIPRGAIVGEQVFVVNDDEAHLRSIKIDRLIGDRAVVSGDLAAGDRVILTNLDVLFEGAPVRLTIGD